MDLSLSKGKIYLPLFHLKRERLELDKEVGWIFVQSDVFRCPQNVLCTFLGTRTQLLLLIIVLFALAFTGFLYLYNRGVLLNSLLTMYTLTSVVAGRTSASFHSHFEEK